jgi:hypothetical protein
MRRASNVEKKALVSMGTCFGKFTKTSKFRLHITALDYLAQYAKYKVLPKDIFPLFNRLLEQQLLDLNCLCIKRVMHSQYYFILLLFSPIAARVPVYEHKFCSNNLCFFFLKNEACLLDISQSVPLDSLSRGPRLGLFLFSFHIS